MRIAILGVALCLSLAAGTRPDFTGTWQLNPAESDFGKAPVPKSMTTRVQQHDPEIVVHSEATGLQGPYSTDYKWITDGRENVNTIRGEEIRATVIWNGKTLISTAKTTIRGKALTVIDQWALSEDGRKLTITRSIVAPQGQTEQKFVYDKIPD